MRTLRALEDFGVSVKARHFLASTASPDAILRTMAYCRKRGYGAGALIRAIREGWTIPEEKKPERETVRYRLAQGDYQSQMPDWETKRAESLSLRQRVAQRKAELNAVGGGVGV